MTSDAVRRWPPAAAGVAALALVFLVLPNPLNVPQNNPTASAEYAPVPGKTDEATNANFGQTNIADSAGIGSGGTGAGLAPGSPPPPPPPRVVPRQVQCVGNPPRQTEDPLSPPCVPFFEGDNGGSTFQGVTRDEIRVIFYNDRCCNGDLTKPWKPSDEAPCVYAFECEYIVRTAKAHLRFFQERYQTYGRDVKLIGRKSSGDVGADCASRIGDAQRDYAEIKPFAVVHLVGGSSACYMNEMRKKGVASFGIDWPIEPQEYEEKAPYVWGFLPDQITKTRWSASFICRKLRNRPAAFTKDPLLKDKTRKFGFIRPSEPTRGPEMMQLSDLLVKELKRDCGMEFDIISEYAGGGSSNAPQIMARMKENGITTIVCYCIPVQTENTTPAMERAATSITYYPEWYHDSSERNDQPAWIQLLGAPDHTRFGATMYWRNEAFEQQPHYQAYRSEEPGTEPNTRFGFDVYHLLLNLYQGIQGAGPTLSPESVERGMFTFNYQNRRNPYVPLGGYGPYNSDAVSDYTFLDSAMGWWWDPSGTPPGGRRGEGCLRVALQGLRFYAGEWEPKNDSDLFDERMPCSQDVREIEEVSAGTI